MRVDWWRVTLVSFVGALLVVPATLAAVTVL